MIVYYSNSCLAGVSLCTFVQWDCVCVCVLFNPSPLHPPRVCSDGRRLTTTVSAPGETERASGQRRSNWGCQPSDTTLCVCTSATDAEHTNTWHTLSLKKKRLQAGVRRSPGAKINWDGSKIGFPQIVLFFIVFFPSFLYQRGETEAQAVEEIDDTDGGESRNAADVMGEAVEWVVGGWRRDSEGEMTSKETIVWTDRGTCEAGEQPLFISSFCMWKTVTRGS